MQPEQTVDLAIEALMAGTADYAVIPQENTVGGAVTNYVDQSGAARSSRQFIVMSGT